MKNNNEQLEKKIIINQYRSLIRSINNKINAQEKKQIREAFNLQLTHIIIQEENLEIYL